MPAIIELCCSGIGLAGDSLSDFQRSTVLKKSGDAGRLSGLPFAIRPETAFRSPFLQNSMRGNSSSILLAAGALFLGMAVLRNVDGERSCPKSWSASFANLELCLVGCV
jgi:hypothetical protein